MASEQNRAIDGTLGKRNDPQFEAVGICHTCKHRRGPWNCTAFPDGIPAKILTGRVIHTSPYPGDHGIVYSRKSGQVSK